MRTSTLLSLFAICNCLIFVACKSEPQQVSKTLQKPAIADSLQISLCGTDGAYNIPFSIVLPEAHDIPGYLSIADSLLLIDYLQNRFDIFSWKTFIALNWPATENGNPDSSLCFGQHSRTTTVWQNWMPSTKIFVPAGQKPAPWKTGKYSPVRYYSNSTAATENATKPGNIHPLNSGDSSILRIAKADSSFTMFDADNYPVVDKNHMYTLFENFYNKQAYDYIVQGKLYSKAGQQQFAKSWPSNTKGITYKINNDTVNIEKNFQRAYFPVGNVKDSSKSIGEATYSFVRNEGAIIIKSAWIVLTDSSEYKNYFTRTINIKGRNRPVTLGLVGMHIIHKVAEVTQWVWSSFEHVDNAPLIDPKTGKAILEPGIDYLYFNEQDEDTSHYNKHTDSIYQPHPFSRKPSQVVKLYPSLKSTDSINALFHNAIARDNKNSVWLHYQLVGTQWSFNPVLFTPGYDYKPALLGNAILETYIQKTSSCMGCHAAARFLYDDPKTFGQGYSADFIWGLNDAK